MRAARTHARYEVKAIEAARRTALEAAFRKEIGAVVRLASPLLVSLLAEEGMSLDDACLGIEPQLGWPARPRLSHGRAKGQLVRTHVLRHYLAGIRPPAPTRPINGGYLIDRKDQGWFCIDVVQHSLEVTATIGPVVLATRLGELRIELSQPIPEALFLASRGRLVEEIVDHEALRGRGWRIFRIEDPAWPEFRQTLVVKTGTVDYRLPWAR